MVSRDVVGLWEVEVFRWLVEDVEGLSLTVWRREEWEAGEEMVALVTQCRERDVVRDGRLIVRLMGMEEE